MKAEVGFAQVVRDNVVLIIWENSVAICRRVNDSISRGMRSISLRVRISIPRFFRAVLIRSMMEEKIPHTDRLT